MSEKKLNLTPHRGRIFVKQDGISASDSKIKMAVHSERPNSGIVVAVGAGYVDYPMECKVGDRVLIEKFKGIEIVLNDTEYLLLTYQEIIANLDDIKIKVS